MESGAGAGRSSKGRTGWGTDLSRRLGGEGGVGAGWAFKQRLDRCKGKAIEGRLGPVGSSKGMFEISRALGRWPSGASV